MQNQRRDAISDLFRGHTTGLKNLRCAGAFLCLAHNTTPADRLLTVQAKLRSVRAAGRTFKSFRSTSCVELYKCVLPVQMSIEFLFVRRDVILMHQLNISDFVRSLILQGHDRPSLCDDATKSTRI